MAHSETSGGIVKIIIGCKTVAALALVACVLPPAAASAAETVVDFEDLPDSASVSDQYLDRGGAGQGPVFGYGVNGEDKATIRPIVDDVGPSAAQSGSKVAEIPITGGEFCAQRAWAEFSSEKKLVRVHVGNYTTPTEMRLRAFDLNGKFVGEDAATPSAAGTFRTPLEVQDPAGRIKFFVVRPTSIPDWGFVSCDQAEAAAIDDLTFDTPDPPDPGDPPEPQPEPDFGLAVISGVTDGVATLRRNGIAVIKIRVNRANGSEGPITFQPSLFAGVDGLSISSEVDNPSNPVIVTVRIQAFENAPAGDYTLHVRAVPGEPGSSPGNAERAIDIPFRVVEDFDARVVGIQVTQAIQGRHGSGVDEPYLDSSTDPQVRTYGPIAGGSSAYLAAGRKTYAFVWANLVSGGSASMPLLLHGSRKGKSLPGSPLVASTRKLSAGPNWVELTDLVGLGKKPYEFILPSEWTKASGLELRAELLPPQLVINSGVECTAPGCAANNQLKLTGVPFVETGQLKPYPVLLHVRGEPATRTPGDAFAGARKMLPLRDGALQLPNGLSKCIDDEGNVVRDSAGKAVTGYMACMDVTKLVGSLLTTKKTLRRKAARMFPCSVFKSQAGLCEWDAPFALIARNIGGQSSPADLPTGNAVANSERPWDTVAHELGHLLGRAHASHCDGGGADGQVAEGWSPDERGFIQGIGFRGGKFAPMSNGGGIVYGPSIFNPQKSQYAPAAGEWFDTMSYCADEDAGDVWASARGWNKDLDFLKNYWKFKRTLSGASAATTSPTERSLHVEATVAGPGGPDFDVWTTDGPAADPPAQSSSHVVVRNAAGEAVANVALIEAPVRDDPHIEVSGDIPIPAGTQGRAGAGLPEAIERLDVVRNGETVVTKVRSANPPTVRFLSPRGKRIGRGPATRVTWRATDADGDALETVLDYSLDNGRTWRPLWSGDDDGRANISSAMLGASRAARFRLRVSDGFDETLAISRRYRAVGRPPTATITSPTLGERLTNASRIYLSGEAWDDSPRQLTGKRLAWYDGRRRIARGAQASVGGLRPGRHVIRLVARDRLARRGSDRVVIRVGAIRPALIVRGAPTLREGSRRLRLRLAATVPSRLTIKGRGVVRSRHRLGRRARPIVVRTRPRKEDLTIRAVLRAGGRRGNATITVPRGAGS
jgi:hypothetical protein